jgi:PTS system galactitol-specific IIC component
MFFIFLIINLLLRMKITRALRSALMYALGLFALTTFAFDVFLGSVGAVASAMIDNLGLSMDTVDFGVGVMPVILNSPIVILSIPVGIGVNILMLALRLTKTIDIDIWNIFYFMGATTVLTYAATDSVLFALLGAAITMAVTLKLADWSAPFIHKALPKFEGLSFPHVYSVFYTPIAYLFNKLFDLIPGIKKSNLSAEGIREKVGVFGEPGMIGFIVGIVMAAFARYNFGDILLTGVKIGASMHFIPITMSVLIEGLSETTEKLGEWVHNKFKDRELFIGLDAVLAAAEPETLAVGVLLAPIAIIVSLILPGNHTLPVGMLSVGFILMALFMPFFKMNILKGILFSVVVVAIELYIGGAIAPVYTELARSAGVEIPYGAAQITNACCIPNLFSVEFFKIIGNLFTGG